VIESEAVVTFGGTPVPKGSLKCVGARGQRRHVLVEDNPRTDEWRGVVASIAGQHLPHAHPGEAVGVEVTFTLPRPVSHYGTGRNERRIKPSSPVHPTPRGTGDVDKLVRLVLDALQDAGVVRDDSQVVEIVARKSYPDTDTPDALPYAGVRIRLYPYAAEGNALNPEEAPA
jgi:Holliday junction resolvase RusA-like endonuclease